jgi:hypothetical protein
VPHTTGTWQTLSYQMPINPISTTMLRDGRILIVAGSENDASNNHTGADTYRVAVWDPTVPDATGFTMDRIPYDVFCSGVTQLPHGLIMISGGSADYVFTGENRGTFFDPATNQFFQTQKMTDGRWYGTATVLGDGRILALSGLNGGGSTTNRYEIYNVNSSTAAGWTAPVAETFTPPLFPRSFMLPNGKLYYSGHGSGTSNGRGYMYDPVANSWSNSALTDTNRNYGTVVLLPLYPPSYATKVIALGGGGSPAVKSTKVVDPSTATSSTTWSAGPDMVTERIELGAVLLPNGRVLVHGGSTNNETPDANGKKAEIYDPTNNTFTPATAGTAAYSRLYHSTSLLLPDARVVSMGGNSGNRGRYLGAIEIYTPAYLYDANDRLITTDRPQITSAPTTPLDYNTGFSVSYTSTSAIASAVLMRPGSTTHAFDMEQRMVGLCGAAPQPACSESGGSLNLTTPLNGNVAPPGFYMLFLLDSAGVPSVAKFIELSPYTGASPDGVITTPANDVTINAGQTVNFGTTTNATKYNWLFPGGTVGGLPYSTAKNPGNVTYSTAGEHYATLIVAGSNGDTDPSPSVRRIHVLPASADFKIGVAQDARTINPGQSATFTVTLTPIKSFSGTVTFSAESEGGIPSGVSLAGFSRHRSRLRDDDADRQHDVLRRPLRAFADDPRGYGDGRPHDVDEPAHQPADPRRPHRHRIPRTGAALVASGDRSQRLRGEAQPRRWGRIPVDRVYLRPELHGSERRQWDRLRLRGGGDVRRRPGGRWGLRPLGDRLRDPAVSHADVLRVSDGVQDGRGLALGMDLRRGHRVRPDPRRPRDASFLRWGLPGGRGRSAGRRGRLPRERHDLALARRSVRRPGDRRRDLHPDTGGGASVSLAARNRGRRLAEPGRGPGRGIDSASLSCP